jgi:predicted N-acetyltransferase YhbS
MMVEANPCYARLMKPLDKQNQQCVTPAPQPWSIRAERPEDASAVEALVDLAFGPGRFAKTAYRLREGVLPEARLSFVAQDGSGEALWGSVRFWPVVVGQSPALLLGPLAVVPQLRGRGIGISLMQHGIRAAAELDYGTVVLVGDEPYYAKVGFAQLTPGQIRFPGPVDPDRVLGLALKGEGLASLSGDVKRARIDIAVSASSAAVGK